MITIGSLNNLTLGTSKEVEKVRRQEPLEEGEIIITKTDPNSNHQSEEENKDKATTECGNEEKYVIHNNKGLQQKIIQLQQ